MMQSFNNISFLKYDMGSNKEKFFRIYSNLPLFEREKVILVIDKQPISWNVAYQQIKNDTELSHKILKILEELEII